MGRALGGGGTTASRRCSSPSASCGAGAYNPCRNCASSLCSPPSRVRSVPGGWGPGMGQLRLPSSWMLQKALWILLAPHCSFPSGDVLPWQS
eukprot:11690529-Heterocapsa_arctica.AAC.1